MTQSSSPDRLRSWGFLLLCSAAGVGVLLLVFVAILAIAPLGEGSPVPAAAPPAPAPSESAVPAPQPMGAAPLPESTTHTTIEAAPSDTGPAEPTDGSVVHPRQEVLVYAEPGGAPLARIGPEQIGDTWLPVIAEQPGWVRVLLPSRPNGSTGWLAAGELDRAVSPYLIRVHLSSLSMELLSDRELLGQWTIGIGKDSAPTPPGRTFLLGSFSDEQQDYSPVILPLGSHSPTLDTFGGGPGTVAIHTWPTDEVFGTQSSDGCIRVPPDALDQLTEVPLGTLVLIDER
ncbi:MAG: L,D-transpeptidase [Pseudonocardiaceae bacterium]